jgi:hypothetical protein
MNTTKPTYSQTKTDTTQTDKRPEAHVGNRPPANEVDSRGADKGRDNRNDKSNDKVDGKHAAQPLTNGHKSDINYTKTETDHADKRGQKPDESAPRAPNHTGRQPEVAATDASIARNGQGDHNDLASNGTQGRSATTMPSTVGKQTHGDHGLQTGAAKPGTPNTDKSHEGSGASRQDSDFTGKPATTGITANGANGSASPQQAGGLHTSTGNNVGRTDGNKQINGQNQAHSDKPNGSQNGTSRKQDNHMSSNLGSMEAQFKEWGAKLDDLVTKAGDAGHEANADYHKGIDDVKARFKTAQIKFDLAKAAGADKWDTFKGETEGAWNEFEHAFKNLSK